MTRDIHIAPITAFHPDMGAIQAQAKAEGFRFVDRLVEEWRSGTNRFHQPGELFLGGFRQCQLLGFCGLNFDPYMNQREVGRLRHLYVLQEARRGGLASALVSLILSEAKGIFELVRLRTDNSEAAEFYTQFGFKPVNDTTATHIMLLR